MKDGEEAAAEVGGFVVVAVDPAGGSGQVERLAPSTTHWSGSATPVVAVETGSGTRPEQDGPEQRRGTPGTRASRQAVRRDGPASATGSRP